RSGPAGRGARLLLEGVRGEAGAGGGATGLEPDHRARGQRRAGARGGVARRRPHRARRRGGRPADAGDHRRPRHVVRRADAAPRPQRTVSVRRAGGGWSGGGLRSSRLHRESTVPALTKNAAPGPITLVATGCGTAIACVCALGLGEIERRLGGLWSVLAVLCAALLCGALARALGRLATVVPSGAGLVAFLSRGLGRRWGLLLMLPYVALVVALVAVEARIVGAVSARLLSVPPALGAVAFLVWTWAVARSGVRFSL